MLSQTELIEEVEELLLARIENGLITDPAVLAQDVMEKHPDLRGADSDFYVLCAWNHVRVCIRILLRDHKLTGEKQSDNPGWGEYIQKAYCVEVNEEPRIIPIDKMSPDQLRAKASELRQMAAGCYKHADELDRFRVSKFGEDA
jgi:hypothetical protein